MTALALTSKEPAITVHGRPSQDVLHQLAVQGWRVRIKAPHRRLPFGFAPRSTLPPQKTTGTTSSKTAADGRAKLDHAIACALLAYRRTMRSQGEAGLPCRAAVEAYQRVRPCDARTSERLTKALIWALRQYPEAFIPEGLRPRDGLSPR